MPTDDDNGRSEKRRRLEFREFLAHLTPRQRKKVREMLGQNLTWLRRSTGTGIGTVASSPIKLKVVLSAGSAYALNVTPKRLLAKLDDLFNDFDFLTKSPPPAYGFPGTTIEFIITGLSVGGWIVAAEFLKEMGKDLWKAIKPFLFEEERLEHNSFFHDRVTVTLVINRKKNSIALVLPTDLEKAQTSEQLRNFLEKTPVNIYVEWCEKKIQGATKPSKPKASKVKGSHRSSKVTQNR